MNTRILAIGLAIALLAIGTASVSAKTDPTVLATIGDQKAGHLYYIVSDGTVWEENWDCKGLQMHETTIIDTGKVCSRDSQLSG